MDTPSDSDDSAFLFSVDVPKRKAGCNAKDKSKKLRLNCKEKNQSVEEIMNVLGMDGQKSKSSESKFIHVNSLQDRNEICFPDSHTVLSNCHIEEDVNAERLLSQKLEDYFSCPLCLKNYQSETAHFSHMKQCAKKSNMSAKQLLAALQLHKRHLKERISAGLSLPMKKRKMREQEENGDTSYHLALALALSKSLHSTNIAGKENQTLTDNIIMHNSNKTTLENFGFKSSGKMCIGSEKISKSRRIIHSVLKERTSEERVKLITEKASMILLINDYTPVSEARKSLRMYHCKSLEKNRNRDSHLWKLGEKIDKVEWYVEDLKNILQGKKIIDKTHETVSHEQCSIDEEISKLNLPDYKIFEDWRRLVNNKHLSDISLNAKDGETIFLHSLVLYARCKKLLDSDLKTVFQKFDSCIILRFLQFLYCGSLNGMRQREVENLFDLARSIECQELVEVLNSLKKYLLESKKNGGNGNDGSRSITNFGHECRKNISITEKNNREEPECTNFGGLEDKCSLNASMNGKSEILCNGIEHVGYENNVDELRRERKGEEANVEYEISNKLHKEDDTLKCDDSPPCVNLENNDETGNGIEKWNYREQVDQFEIDMFTEMENLNQTILRNFVHDSNPMAKDDQECVEISSCSTKSDKTLEENREIVDKNRKVLAELDYEIPYFDPYEHFNNEIPENGSYSDLEERNIPSQSLIVGEVSPVKSESPKSARRVYIDDVSPSISVPGWCSTPNNEMLNPSKSANIHLSSKEHSVRVKRRKYGTPCSKVNRKLARVSVRSKLFCRKSRKKRKTWSNKENNEKLESVLTEPILREVNDSIKPSVRKSPPTEETNYIEVTPIITDEEYVLNFSPFPDYSVMGATSIKKHLAKYGLKKSLSKNKAKKILRHIYEELHPVVNMKNGKIVKYMQSEKSGKCKRKKIVRKDKLRKKNASEKRSVTPRRAGERISETCWIEHASITNKKLRGFSERPKLTSLESTITKVKDGEDNKSEDDDDDDTRSYQTIDSDVSSMSDGSYFEMEEPLSQGNYSSAADAVAAVYDFIEHNQDIHRQILMYESISLENLQRQLFENYNKKFRLDDLMDCLDDECITFHCAQDEHSKVSKTLRKAEDSSLCRED